MRAWRAFAGQQEQGEAQQWQESAPSGPPTGVAVFAADSTIRSLMDPHGRIAHWSEFDRAAISPPWKSPTCSPPTSAPSAVPCADVQLSPAPAPPLATIPKPPSTAQH
jgi:hypothetical protein